MATRSPSNRKGVTSVQVLILLVPVFMGMIGFAIDLGRLYSARAELKAAANAMALAAAAQLIGTDAATGNATSYSGFTEDNSGFGNKYDFNGNLIGLTSASSLNSTVSPPGYYQALTDAIGDVDATGSTASGSTAKYVRINMMGEAPLVFWNFIPLAQNRRLAVQATAVAGVSAPLCTACSIEPIGVAALDSTDLINFGFVPQTIYTFSYVCSGGTPPTVSGGGPIVQYVLLNRLSANVQAFTAEASQLMRMGAGGLPASTISTDACFFINTAEQIWATATPGPCTNSTVNSSTTAFLCGVALRFDSALQSTCTGIQDSDTIATIYTQDPDLTSVTDYTQYLGYGRRVITIPIVDSTANTAAMTVLGFRQFLVEPAAGSATINAADANGSFIVLYLGTVKPIPQGQIGGCSQSAGPGKVVLHR